MKKQSKILTALIASVAMPCLASPASAQSSSAPADQAAANDHSLQEIVVTARKREESLIAVPVAVSAYGRQELERASVVELTKVAQLTPAMSAQSSPFGTSFVIRGIGSATLDPGLEQSVTLNLDGVNAGRGLLASVGVFDLEQIEVLKGPQALFFGKNSPAGVVSVKTAGPTDRVSGYIRAGYEFEARERYVEGAIGGPLSETLGARLAVRASKMAGWVINAAQPIANPFAPAYSLPGAWSHRVPHQSDYLGRLTLVWKPSDRLSFTLKAFGAKHRDNSFVNESICPGAFPFTFGVPDTQGDCKLNGREAASATPAAIAATFPHPSDKPYTRAIVKLLTVKSDYELTDDVSVTSVTGYYTINQRNFHGAYEGAIGFIHAYNSEKSRFITEEVRATSTFDGPINFTVGGYFEDGHRSAYNAAQIAFVGPDPVTGKFQSAERAARVESQAYSLFGQLRWQLMSNVELAGGARWTKEKKSLSTGNTFVHPFLAAVFLPAGVTLAGKDREHNISPEATLTWHPTPDSTLYGAFKTGYKSGGFANPPLLTAGINQLDNVRFGAEKAKGGEIGYKARLFDRTVQIELSAYRYTFKGLQLTSFDAPTLSYRIRNAAAVRTQGLELSTTWRPVRQLTIRADGAYSRARFTDFATATCYQGQTAAQGCVGGLTQDLTGQQRGTRAGLVRLFFRDL